MRPPAYFGAGNLVWSTEGTVWAWWRVGPTGAAYAGAEAIEAHRLATRAVLLALPPEARLAGVCRPVSPAEVVEAVIDGVDVEAHPAWAAEATAALDLLCEHECFERVRYVAARLPDSPGAATRTAVAAAGAAVAVAFGLPYPPPPPDERLRRVRQADEIERRLTRLVPVERLEAAEVDWLTARLPRRGVAAPTVAEVSAGRPCGVRGEGALRVLDGAVWHEGGPVEGRRPLRRRLVSATTEAGTSWQAYAALGVLPSHWTFPGTWLSDVDRLGAGADWCVHIEAVPNPEARTKTRRSHRKLVAQVDEYRDEPSGPPPDLAGALEDIEDERARLAANPTDPELVVAVGFSVAGADPDSVETDIRALAEAYGPNDYVLHRPPGGQLESARALLPGAGLTRTERQYRNHLLPGDLAAALPFAGTRVGDPVGCLWGFSLDDGAGTPVLLDPSYGPRVLRRNGSVGVVGDNGSGKALALNTPILTTVGWKTMADVEVGDEVFDDAGRPAAVVGTSPVFHGHDCYEVEFDSGEVIVADGDHLWFASSQAERSRWSRENYKDRQAGRSERHGGPTSPGAVRSTREMATTTHVRDGAVVNWSVAVAQPLQYADSLTVIDPYVLGIWLGDGSSRGGAITTADPEIVSEMVAAGREVWKVPSQKRGAAYLYRVKDLTTDLRGVGLLLDKQVPTSYLEAGIEDRLALLQGLMDSDGWVGAASASATFTTTNPKLRDGVVSLVASLGWKPYCREGRASLYGKDCGPKWDIRFTADRPVFRLPRKRTRQRMASRVTQQRHYVVAIRSVESRPTRCITVASASHLFLAGRSLIPTHNSYAVKRLAWATVARGGRVVALDRTDRGEWAEFAGLVPGAQVVRVGPGERICVDPLRVLPVGHSLRVQLATGVLLIATRTAPAELDGTALARAVAEVAARPEGSCADVLDVLATMAADGHPEADEVGRKLANLAGADLGQLVFGTGGRVLDLAGDMVVLHVPGLNLPDREVLLSESLSRFLLPEQLWSQALLYLLTGFGREAIFADRRRFGALVVDEAWAVTASMQGERLMTATIRDGPKHNAALWIISQDVARLGSKAVRDLLRVRMAFRHTTAGAAAEAIEFCGVPPSPALAEALADPSLEPGTQLLRDVRGGVGMVAVLPALQEAHRPYYSTYGADTSAVVASA